MKHLTILSISVATILLAGSQFHNRFNHVYSEAKKTEESISNKVNELQTQSDSLFVETGSKVTSRVVDNAGKTTFRFIDNIVRSLF